MENKSSAGEDANTRSERVKNKLNNNRIVIALVICAALIAGIAKNISALSTIGGALHGFLPPTSLYTYHGHGGLITDVAWSPDGMRIASSSSDGSIQIWNASTGDNILHHQLRSEDEGHSVGSGIAWSPDGNYIACWTTAEVQIWEAATGKIIQNYRIHKFSDPIDAIDIAWSPNSKLIASTSYGKVHIWNVLSGRDIQIYSSINQASVTFSLAWSSDGNYIASAQTNTVEEHTVTVWDVANGHLVATNKNSKEVDTVAWSPDSQFIASRTSNEIKIWNPSNGAVSTFPGVNGTTYNPSRFTCPSNKNATLYDLHPPINMGWSPNSRYFTYICVDTSKSKWEWTIYIWDFFDQKLFTHHGNNATWSQDSKYLAITNDLTVEIWQVTDLWRSFPF